MPEYDQQWLDDFGPEGRVICTRPAALGTARAATGVAAHAAAQGAEPERGRGASPIRSTPITLLARRNVPLWSALTDQTDPTHLTSRAASVAEFIREHGPSSFDEIAQHAGMLPLKLQDPL